MINALLDGIECRTNCDYFNDKSYLDGLSNKIVYSGAIDEYFDHRLGHLAYRSLRFEQEIIHNSDYQGNAIVNYTDIDTPFTRIVEHKHFDSLEEAVASGADIHSQVRLQDFSNHRMLVRETDIGKQLEDQVRNLKKLLYAYRHGILRESYPDEE